MSQRRRKPAPITQQERERVGLMRQIRQMATRLRNQEELERALAGLEGRERDAMLREIKPYLTFEYCGLCELVP